MRGEGTLGLLRPFQRTLRGALVRSAILGLAVSCGSSTAPPNAVTSGTPSNSPTIVSPVPACTMPLTHDTYNGFHIAVPTGWELSSLNGQILVESDSSGTESVLVYAAIQTTGLTPASFFTSYLGFFEQQVARAGNSVTAQPAQGQPGVPTESLNGTAGGQAVAGMATVVQLPLQTQLSSTELVFIAYWAPTQSFPTESGMLASIGHCYGPEAGTLYRVFRDQAFTYIMPPQWVVAGETQNSIDLHLGTTADVSYALFEAIQSSQVGSGRDLVGFVLGQEGLTNVHALWTATTPNQQAGSGVQSGAYEEFTATLGGNSTHGLIFALADVGGGGKSGYMRIAITTADQWNAMNAALIQMAGAIQHDFTQDLQQLQRINQEFQNFSGQVANFDDVLNQQQLVQDPSTGTYYEAPYSSYIVNGSAGPGYYLPNGQPLNVIQRT
jgi:hypothetical protein